MYGRNEVENSKFSANDNEKTVGLDNEDDKLQEMTASYSEISFNSQSSPLDSDLKSVINSSHSSDIERMPENSSKNNVNNMRPGCLHLDSDKQIETKKFRHDPTLSKRAIDYLQLEGTVTNDGNLILFVAEDLENKIKLSSPITKKGETISNLRLSTFDLCRQTFTPQLSILDHNVLNELEIEARRLATSVDSITENLAAILHSASALTVCCLETYRDTVCKTCDSIDYNIKSMYQLIAKCEELSKSMTIVYKISEKFIDSRLQSENLFLSTIYIRENYTVSAKRSLRHLKTKIEVSLSLEEMMKYHDKSKVIQDATDNMNKLIEKELEQNTNNTPTNSAHIPDGCVPIEVENAMNDFKAVQEKAVINEQDLQNSITQFNSDQLRVFNKITSILESKDKILRMFVSGPGGTGKSKLIEILVPWNKMIRGKDTSVTAPTGIAAYNIQGLTIHRLLMLPVEHGGTAEYKELSAAARKQIKESLNNVDLIIIDEISMVSNITLMYIHLRLLEIFSRSDDEEDTWFGKINVLVFGDLLQLPPVRENFVFVGMTKTKLINTSNP